MEIRVEVKGSPATALPERGDNAIYKMARSCRSFALHENLH